MAGPALRLSDVDRAFALRSVNALLKDAKESLATVRVSSVASTARLRDAVYAQSTAIARLLEVVEDLVREDRR